MSLSLKKSKEHNPEMLVIMCTHSIPTNSYYNPIDVVTQTTMLILAVYYYAFK